MSIARHHHEWLSLVETSGPFLSLPVLLRAFPQGLDRLDEALRQRLRTAYEEWQDNQQGLRPAAQIHYLWVQWVLSEVLGMEEQVLRDLSGEGAGDPTLTAAVTVKLEEVGEILQPDFVVVEPINILSPPPPDRFAPRPRLLVQVAPHDQALERPLRHSQASPATRMMELLHATGVRLGLVTNGEQWLLVDAPKGETTGYTTWHADYWLEEPLTLRAFRSLLHARRFWGVPATDTLEALLAESATYQQEVTDQLGLQVRHAVELLVQAMDKADQEAGRHLLADLPATTLYEAAVTVMMRLVFLLCAEERNLLPLTDPLYSQHYAVSTLQEQLRKLADQTSEEVLEYRYDAWPRLLAVCRAVHGGLYHDRLHLPAYGSGLFDPDRFPFLGGWVAGGEERVAGSGWRVERNSPLTTRHSLCIDNRTVLHLLEALQLLQVKLPGGGLSEARRVSFRTLDIEQIGYVYEGLLDHTARRAETLVLGLAGAKAREPEVPLSTLAALLPHDNAGVTANHQLPITNHRLMDFLQEQTGRSENALRKAVSAPAPDLLAAQRLRAACNNDEALYQRLLPWHALLRTDDYGRPVVIHAGSFYVTAGAERRATGAHYTPRSLTEPIVQHTLEPLVYSGPAEGKPRSAWRLRTPAELLRLKLCDMAMGSGAFLVQTARYLADRLLAAWELYDPRKNSTAPATAKEKEILGDALLLRTAEESQERATLARRLVADRCLYGVDKNPLAVEMAKLSLWLITMDKGKPFTFLDHALKCGDSLVGVNLEQLRCWNLAGSGQRQFGTVGIDLDIQKMVQLRQTLEEQPVQDIYDQQHKAYLLTQAEAIAHDLKRAGDDLVASYYNDLPKAQQATLRHALLAAHRDGASVEAQWRRHADLGDLRPFHWALEFPEVFLAEGRSGFDAFVGNPPFVGGRRIRETLGDCYRLYLDYAYLGSSGNADLSAFFFLRTFTNLQAHGNLGLIATNTIAQGDTRLTGLATFEDAGGTIFRAINNMPWPGQAAVVVNIVHISKSKMKPPFDLDNQQVQYISSLLDNRRVTGEPYTLIANEGKSHMGTNVVGLGFTMSPEEAEKLIARDSRNAKVLFPYLNGQDLNTFPDQSPSRWIINFFNWPRERTAPGSWSQASEKQQHIWLQSGVVPKDYPDYVAADYPDCYSIIQARVYPERRTKEGSYARLWWQYGRRQERLYEAMVPLERVLVVARVSKTVAFVLVPKGWIYNEKVVAFAYDTGNALAILQSSIHNVWAWKYSSTLKSDLNYAPTDCFENYPMPCVGVRGNIDTIGENYHEHRRQLMLTRQEGLTATYNRFHRPDETSADIVRLRHLHVEMDHAVAAAYGWSDLDLGHGFHDTAQGLRYTISEPARREVLSRLLALNHERYAEEVKAGLHEKKGKKKGNGNSNEKIRTQMSMFEP
ncbi:MAG: type IIL restriction-modification enzyme MmeI [Caldilineaceae bacterium]